MFNDRRISSAKPRENPRVMYSLWNTSFESDIIKTSTKTTQSWKPNFTFIEDNYEKMNSSEHKDINNTFDQAQKFFVKKNLQPKRVLYNSFNIPILKNSECPEKQGVFNTNQVICKFSNNTNINSMRKYTQSRPINPFPKNFRKLKSNRKINQTNQVKLAKHKVKELKRNSVVHLVIYL